MMEENEKPVEQETVGETEPEAKEEKAAEPTPEELLAAEKDRYTRLYAEYENYH